MPVADPLGVADALQRADDAAFQQFLDAREEHRVAQHMRDGDVRALARRRFQQALHLALGRADRLFQQHGDAAVDRRQCRGQVQLVGGGNDDRVERRLGRQQRFPGGVQVLRRDPVLRARPRPGSSRGSAMATTCARSGRRSMNAP